MKKLVCVFLVLLCLCGCSPSNSDNTDNTHSQITINLPTDDTVNGYRQGGNSQSMPQIISADEVKPASPEQNSSVSKEQNSSAESTKVEYIGNLNTHIFHKSTCGSVSTMKEENKIIFEGRDDAINGGYTPCKRCNP